MKHFFYSINFKWVLLFLICNLGFACVHQKQVAVQKKAASAAVVKQADVNHIQSVAAKKDQKFQQGEIDTIIKRNVEEKLRKYTAQQDTLSRAIAYLELASKDKNVYKKNKDYVSLQLKVLKYFKDNYNARVRRIAMIDTSLDWTTLHQFNLAAFFGPGKYEMPADKMRSAEIHFTPMLDSLVTFYNKYQDIPREATLIIRGFADGLPFTVGTETYIAIANLLKQTDPPKEQMNKKLSEMRADKMGDVMENLLARKINGYDSVRKVDFVFYETGQGEQFPSKSIRDYKTDDERRRVVLFYWNILPK